MQNAHCDMDIFDDIYRGLRDVDLVDNWKFRHARLAAARKTIKQNLAHMLDALRKMFNILHRQEFAVCIQFLKPIERNGAVVRTIETLMRDPVSAAGVENGDREHDDFHEVEANTISHRIYNLKEEFVHCDNLREKIRADAIHTTSRNAGVRYNAVYVRRLLHYKPGLNERIQSDSITSLCVDTPADAFDPERLPVSKHFAAEIGWRVSVMLYRLEILEEELQILTQR